VSVCESEGCLTKTYCRQSLSLAFPQYCPHSVSELWCQSNSSAGKSCFLLASAKSFL